MNTASRTVNQYGVDYIRINCPGNYTLRFEGATSTRLLPADPHSGSYAFWSNKGDKSDMTLTHAVRSDRGFRPGQHELLDLVRY